MRREPREAVLGCGPDAKQRGGVFVKDPEKTEQVGDTASCRGALVPHPMRAQEPRSAIWRRELDSFLLGLFGDSGRGSSGFAPPSERQKRGR